MSAVERVSGEERTLALQRLESLLQQPPSGSARGAAAAPAASARPSKRLDPRLVAGLALLAAILPLGWMVATFAGAAQNAAAAAIVAIPVPAALLIFSSQVSPAQESLRLALERRLPTRLLAFAAAYAPLWGGLTTALGAAMLVPVGQTTLMAVGASSLIAGMLAFAVFLCGADRALPVVKASAWGVAATLLFLAVQYSAPGVAPAAYVFLSLLAALLAATAGARKKLDAWGAPGAWARELVFDAVPKGATARQRWWARALAGSAEAREAALREMRAEPGEARALEGPLAALADRAPRELTPELVDFMADLRSPGLDAALARLTEIPEWIKHGPPPAKAWAKAALQRRALEEHGIAVASAALEELPDAEAAALAAARGALAVPAVTMPERLRARAIEDAVAALQASSGDERRLKLEALQRLLRGEDGSADGSKAAPAGPAIFPKPRLRALQDWLTPGNRFAVLLNVPWALGMGLGALLAGGPGALYGLAAGTALVVALVSLRFLWVERIRVPVPDDLNAAARAAFDAWPPAERERLVKALTYPQRWPVWHPFLKLVYPFPRERRAAWERAWPLLSRQPRLAAPLLAAILARPTRRTLDNGGVEDIELLLELGPAGREQLARLLDPAAEVFDAEEAKDARRRLDAAETVAREQVQLEPLSRLPSPTEADAVVARAESRLASLSARADLVSRLEAQALAEALAQAKKDAADPSAAALSRQRLEELLARSPAPASGAGSSALPAPREGWQLFIERRVPLRWALALGYHGAVALAVGVCCLLPLGPYAVRMAAFVLAIAGMLQWALRKGKPFAGLGGALGFVLFVALPFWSEPYVLAAWFLGINGLSFYTKRPETLAARLGVPGASAREALRAEAPKSPTARQRWWLRALSGSRLARDVALREMVAAPAEADGLVPAIAQLARSGDPAVAPELFEALSRLGTPRADEALRSLASELQGPAHRWAAEALAPREPGLDAGAAQAPGAAAERESDILDAARALAARKPRTLIERLRARSVAEALARVEASSGDERRLALEGLSALLREASGDAAGAKAAGGRRLDWRLALERRAGPALAVLAPRIAVSTLVNAALFGVAALLPLGYASVLPALGAAVLFTLLYVRSGSSDWRLRLAAVLPLFFGAALLFVRIPPVGAFIFLCFTALGVLDGAGRPSSDALLASAGVPASAVRKAVVRSLTDATPRQRAWARALAGTHRARGAAIQEMNGDLAEAAGVVPALVQLARAGGPAVPPELFELLARIGTPESVAALKALSLELGGQPRTWAAEALAELQPALGGAPQHAADPAAERAARLIDAARALASKEPLTLVERLRRQAVVETLARLEHSSADQRRLALENLDALLRQAADDSGSGSRALPGSRGDWRLTVERWLGPVPAVLAGRAAGSALATGALLAIAASLPFPALGVVMPLSFAAGLLAAWLYTRSLMTAMIPACGLGFAALFAFIAVGLPVLPAAAAWLVSVLVGIMSFPGPNLDGLLAGAGVVRSSARRAALRAARARDARQRRWAGALAGTDRARRAAIAELAAAPRQGAALAPAIEALLREDESAASPELLQLLGLMDTPESRRTLARLARELKGPARSWAAEALSGAPLQQAVAPAPVPDAEAAALAEARALLAGRSQTLADRLRRRSVAEAVSRVESASGEDRRLALESLRALLRERD